MASGIRVDASAIWLLHIPPSTDGRGLSLVQASNWIFAC